MNNQLDYSQMTHLQKIILEEFPMSIGHYYSKILSSTDVQEKTRRLIPLFEYILNLCSIVLISQYLRVDRDTINDQSIDQLLSSKLSRPTLGTWVEILFKLAKAYYERPELDLFVPEFRSLNINREIKLKSFQQIVIIRNNLVHRTEPSGDEEWKALFDQLHNLVLEIFHHLTFISKYKFSIQLVYSNGGLTSLTALEKYPNILESTVYLRNDKGDLLELSPFLIGERTNASEISIVRLDSWTSSALNYSTSQGFMRIEREFFLSPLEILPKIKASRKPKVFISYAKQDVNLSEQVLEFFSSVKCEVWIDKANLLPGQDWEYEIKKAIDESDYFVACLSSKSVSKVGFVQKELKLALSVLEKFPEGKVFIIPIRLDECQIPSQLARYHYVDWFAENTKELLRKTVTQ